MPPSGPPAGPAGPPPGGGAMAMIDLAMVPPEILDLLMELGALQMPDMGPGMGPEMGLGPDPSMEGLKRALMGGGGAPIPGGF